MNAPAMAARPVRASRPPTFAALVAAEPRLGALLREARAVRADDPRYCGNAVWYGFDDWRASFKARLSALVGWDRHGHPLLGTEAAYDVAYETVYDALPGCRDCGCL